MNNDCQLIYEAYKRSQIKESAWLDNTQPEEREYQSLPDGTKVKFSFVGTTPREFGRKYPNLSLFDLNHLNGKVATIKNIIQHLSQSVGDKDFETYKIQFPSGIILHANGKMLEPVQQLATVAEGIKWGPIHVPRHGEKKPKMAKPQRQIEQSPVGNHNVKRIVRRVELHLGDAVEDPENLEDCAENCWTLAIDAAHDIGLEGDQAIYAAKKACKQLGYTVKPIKESNDGKGFYQHNCLAVIDNEHDENILFCGTREECLHYMKIHHDWSDLMYATKHDDGKVELGRFASYILESNAGDFPSDINNPGEIFNGKYKNIFTQLIDKIKELTGKGAQSPTALQSITKNPPNRAVPPQHPPIENEHNGPSYGYGNA